jgi:hypothetical protein
VSTVRSYWSKVVYFGLGSRLTGALAFYLIDENIDHFSRGMFPKAAVS